MTTIENGQLVGPILTFRGGLRLAARWMPRWLIDLLMVRLGLLTRATWYVA